MKSHKRACAHASKWAWPPKFLSTLRVPYLLAPTQFKNLSMPLHMIATKCYHWPVHLQNSNYHNLESTQNQSCNLWIPDWVINELISGGHCQKQLAMTLDSRGQLRVSRPIRAYSKYIIKQILHRIYSEHTFCANMTFKVHGSILRTLLRYLLRMVWFKKDVIARCLTHKSKCAIYLTVVEFFHCKGCIYEHVDSAVVIWCWTSD